ncbi:MAG: amino acid racemase [Oscillospiraceae bacterium]|nr:amino acid racemase [Oscillospiraceae bacterium]
MMKTIGILGGLGPAASSRLYDMLIRMRQVTCDQDHPDVILYSKASVPDRTAFLLGNSDVSPLPALIGGLQTLQAAGAHVLAMPCATAHHFYDELQAAVDIPLLNMLALTAQHLAANGITCAGLLCTLGSYHSGAFVRALQAQGIEVFLPDNTHAVMDVINAVKLGAEVDPPATSVTSPPPCRGASGDNLKLPLCQGPPSRGDVAQRQGGSLSRLAQPLLQRGAQTVILGCTELSLLAEPGEFYTDPMQILAKELLRLMR